jgi:hypothetical protein
MLAGVHVAAAQDTPLLSGGVGFLTSTNGGNTTYTPIIEPLLAAPIGRNFSRLEAMDSQVTTTLILLGSPTCRRITLFRATLLLWPAAS